MNGTKVDRFRPQMGYLKSFLESSIEKLQTMPLILQTLDLKFRTSCGKFKTLRGKFKGLGGKFKTLHGKFQRLPGKLKRLDGKFQTLGLKLRTDPYRRSHFLQVAKSFTYVMKSRFKVNNLYDQVARKGSYHPSSLFHYHLS